MAYDASYKPTVTTPSHPAVSSSFYEDSPTTKYEGGVYLRHQEEEGLEDVGLENFSEEPKTNKYSTFSLYWNFRKWVSELLCFTFRLIYHGKNILAHQRQTTELNQQSSSLLRFLCFIGGLAMAVSSVICMMNVMLLLKNPLFYVLQIYQGIFGTLTMVVEAKDWDCLDKFKPIIVHWFRFLTIPFGKSLFYIFVGALSTSLWLRNILVLAIGVYMTLMGLISFFLNVASISQFLINYNSNAQHLQHSMLSSDNRIPGITSLQNNNIYSEFTPCGGSMNSPEFEDDEEVDDEEDVVAKFEPFNLHKCMVQERGSRNETTTATETGAFCSNQNENILGIKDRSQPFIKRKNPI